MKTITLNKDNYKNMLVPGTEFISAVGTHFRVPDEKIEFHIESGHIEASSENFFVYVGKGEWVKSSSYIPKIYYEGKWAHIIINENNTIERE